jgi:KaiC/GvpD/RAD55 family RecA-like ATPase
MNDYLVILKVLLTAEHRKKYLSSINLNYLKENHPLVYKLFITLQSLPEEQNITLPELELVFYSLYPMAKRGDCSVLFNSLHDIQLTASVALPTIQRIAIREHAITLAATSLAFSEGQKSITDLERDIERLKSLGSEPEPALQDEEFVSTDIEAIYQEDNLTPGLLWPLRSLNEVLGPLRKGDFGFLFARPETGKTTFLTHSVTHFAKQALTPLVWFNNEEKGTKVMKRCYQAYFGLPQATILANLSHYKTKFEEVFKGKLQIKDDANISKKQVEEVCRRHNPSLIIFDQIDKISGFDAERYDLKMKAIYQWARELAKTYGPVIAVCQAGGTADNKKYLQMNDVDSSHTAKQGEADWMLGIGKIDKDGMEEVRYFSVPKNKLDGDPNYNKEDRRHDKWEVIIKPEIARYEDY